MGRAVLVRYLAAALAVVALAACRPRASAPSAAPATAAASGPLPSSRAEGDRDPRRAASLAVVERIGVIGASVSAGFGDSIPLHEAIDAALLPPHAVFDASSSAMFMRPDDIAQVQLGVMRLRNVRMVIAVDFLFWFAAGDKTSAEREADLERGLLHLDTLDVPIFVGDLPDVRGADPRMIAPRQIPTAEELERLDDRIRAWAQARPRVHLLPLRAWTRAWQASETVQILGRPHTAGPHLIQPDRLHPAPAGQAWLAALVLERVVAALPGLSRTDLVADPEVILREVGEVGSHGADPIPARRGAQPEQGGGERGSDAIEGLPPAPDPTAAE